MAVSVSFVPPTDDLCQRIAESLREGDVTEVMRSGGFTPIAAVVSSVEWSDQCMVALFDGEPGAVFGVTDYTGEFDPGRLLDLMGREWASRLYEGRVGVVWALTSSTITDSPIAFHKASLAQLEGLSEGFDFLLNFVDADNEGNIQWLRSIGFEILEAVEYGTGGEPFHPAIYEVPHV